MDLHQEKVNRIARQLQERTSTTPLTLKKKAVSHQVPRPHDKKYTDEKLDISDLDQIIAIDLEQRICIAEPGVTFAEVVKATLPQGLIPLVVPELKTITVGGAVAGCSIESMSFKVGGFHDSCLKYEVVTATGDILVCSPDNENQLLFQMLHGTFGTLGIITKLTFKLITAQPYVRVTYERYSTLDEYKAAIWRHYALQDIDFMDGIIHSTDLYVLSAGQFVDQAPYTNRYDWTKIYYLSTSKRNEDYLRTPDYLFRYNKGVTNVHPRSFLGRLLLGRFTNANRALRFAKTFRKVIPATVLPITVDTFIPFAKIESFMDWYRQEINHFPLWCVPYRIPHLYEWISDELAEQFQDELVLDIAIYGMHRDHAEQCYRTIEKELIELGTIKTLISTNLYTEEEFWKLWNKKNYDRVKQQTDPDNIFRGLFEKMCR